MSYPIVSTPRVLPRRSPLKVCQATKSDGTPCKNPPIIGSKFCRYHQGTVPKGFLSPSYKHGRYSKYLPSGLQAIFEEGGRDPELLSLEEDIRLMEARVLELLERVQSKTPSSQNWEKAQEIVGALKTLLQGIPGVPAEAHDLLRQLTQTLRSPSSDRDAWREIQGAVEQKRKLVEQETRRLMALKQYIPLEDVYRMVAALAAAVRSYVHDPSVLTRISGEFIRITNGRLGEISESDDSDVESREPSGQMR